MLKCVYEFYIFCYKMSINKNMKGTLKMRVGILCDDDVHGKMKIISAYKRKSLNTLTVDFYKEVIAEWEKEHGEIKFPD